MSILEPDWRSAQWQARAVADGRATADGEGDAAVRQGGG